MPRTFSGSARRQVLDALIGDHKEVKRLFREFERLRHAGDSLVLVGLAEQACTLLQQHAALEEEFFYPALRGVVKDEDVLDEAAVEHANAKSLMGELHQSDGDQAHYAATFKVLGEYVKHHIREEEGDLFQRLTRARVDWDQMLIRMQDRRSEYLALESRNGGGDDPPSTDDESADPVGAAELSREEAATEVAKDAFAHEMPR